MNATQYIDRTIDIAAFQGFSGRESELRQTLADAGHSGNVITGILKLGQRFLLELFTEKGSLPFAPTRGSTFMLEARQGFIRSQVDLIAAFTRAQFDIRQSLTDDERDSDPADEKFSSASLGQIVFSPGYANLQILLASQDPAATLILPVPFAFEGGSL